MKLTLRPFVVLAGLAGASACATKSLPPGTPPPEYEQRTLEPWPPASVSDAGTDAEPVPQEPVPLDVPAPPTDALVPPADAPAAQ